MTAHSGASNCGFWDVMQTQAAHLRLRQVFSLGNGYTRRTTVDAFLTPEFWIAVGQIILIDILLGGDNAVVIALALQAVTAAPAYQRGFMGNGWRHRAARDLIAFALTLLQVPYQAGGGATVGVDRRQTRRP